MAARVARRLWEGAVSLEEQIARVVEDTVRRVVREELAGHHGDSRRELISKRTAARMLGIDRGTTLAGLISDGHLRTVELRGRVCIPRADVDRLVASGAAAREAPARRRPGGASGAVALRSVKVEDL